MPTTIDNLQPSVAVTEAIVSAGLFPSRDGGASSAGVMGSIRHFACNFVPDGTLGTHGDLLPISQNTALFSLLGTYYGGNGQSNFALPDLETRLSIGEGAGPGLPEYSLGEPTGVEDLLLVRANMQANLGGTSEPFDNRAPSLGVTYVINAFGTFNGGLLTDIGLVWEFAGNFAPGGTFECNGQLLSIAEYETLFTLIGTTYGGDGETTFALPDLRGRTIVGVGAGRLLGESFGTETQTVGANNLPSEMAGPGQPLDNHGPSLVLNYMIALQGIFPGNDGVGTLDSSVPVLGEIVATAGNSIPNGFAACNGQLLPINQNQALFALLGTTYGGNGQTNFALPDLRGQALIGSDSSGLVGPDFGAELITLTHDNIPDLYVTGTNGADALYGANETDSIFGLDDNDSLVGFRGDDYLDGGAGDDSMTGGLGNDIYIVDSLLDAVIENAAEGIDEIRTGLSSYSIAALPNVENLTGEGPDGQLLTGNDSNNRIDGGAGADTMTGGLGNDIYLVDSVLDAVIESANEGIDEVRTNLSAYSLAAQPNVENLTGGASDQQLTGNEGNNRIDGGAGADTMIGNGGNDQIDGEAGADTMIGGAGNDNYWVDNAGDVVTEAVGEGTDTVRSTISYTLGDNVEHLVLYGPGAVDGTGNGLANIIFGNGAANTLDGGAGADSLRGGGGDDSYVIDNVGDRALESVGAGTDTVTSSLSFVLGPNVENLILSGGAAINGSGNALANNITGNSAANILNGQGGADTMTGGGGNDIYFVDNVGDSAVEDGGQGTDLVKSSVSFTLGDNVENLLLFGLAAVDATGNALANTLTGNSAANTLSGLGGNDYLAALGGSDRLDGGTGADQLIGGGGGDLFVFASALDAATNVDWIRDFSVAADTIALDLAVFTALSGAGTLAHAAFCTGAAAADATDRIIYNDANGFLYYDADGSGAGAQIQFARVAIGLGMTAADFIVEG